MSDNGRIDREFWDHPKVKAAGNAAIGLWARTNSWCRYKRTAGHITPDVALELGTQDEIDALVRERLWLKTSSGYVMKDYADWNDDVEPDTVAGAMVREVVPVEHPSAIRKQLARRAAELIAEGIDPDHVKRGLVLWTEKDLSPSLLPSLVSQAMNTHKQNQSLLNVLRDCWRTGDVSPLKPFGFIFTIPDLPSGIDASERRDLIREAQKAWLLEVKERVK
ncbi:Uncharacterised protein [Mycobacteroides abscessus subsp. abscessus]|uniref:hypothetical protein n=1 Tax=Mycobacteroides abscessus TaxID=36809 RepID=UPI00092A6823|nr:hypothetical protein [Mycobacteroides abscessus]UVK63448.1 hypothetical protein SEA_BAUDELAIRE_74 [Mycobacterium phage Baudelaire]WKW86566.1 hypothetical protein SEA_AEGEUS_74 [Mycobacterium phage Aegeus]SIL73510.1 Uncharacterised protein [Mycobacteroides abscessus subsp. abscessus]